MNRQRHIEALLAQVRLVLSGRGSGSPEDAVGLLRQAEAFWDELDGTSPESSRYGTAIAYHAAAVAAESQEKRIITNCLELLMEQSTVGFMLAASGLALTGAAGESYRSAVAGLDRNERLALINRRLACVRDEDPATRDWGRTTAKAIQGEDPEEALVFLDRLSERGEPLSLAVQNSFLRGRLGVWLHQLLKLKLDTNQASYMAATVGELRSRDLALLLSKHLQTLHGQGQGHGLSDALDVLGRAGGGAEGRLHEIVARFLGHRDDNVALAAARALVRLRADDAPDKLAVCFHKRATLRPAVAGLVVRFTWKEYTRFLAKLPGKDRHQATLLLAAAIAAAFPGDTASLVARVKGGAAMAPVLEALGKQGSPLSRKPGFKAAVPKRRAADADEDAGILDKVRGIFGGEKDDEATQGLLGSLAKGQNLEDKNVRNENAPTANMAGNTFARCSLAGCQLPESDFQDVTFSECRLSNVDFSSCRAQGLTFQDCILVNCRFSNSSLRATVFRRCALTRTHLAACVTVGLRIEESTVRQCNGWGARLKGAKACTSLFEESDFSYSDFTDARFDGCRFTDCLFDHAHADGARFGTVTTQACTFSHAVLRGLDTNDPSMLGARDERMLADVEATSCRPPKQIPPPLKTARGFAFLRIFLEQWFFEKDACIMRTAFLRQNRRRLDWCRAKMLGPKALFLDALPGLVQAPVLRTLKGFEPAPAIYIRGWTPGLDARIALKTLLKGAPEPGRTAKPLPLEGLYSIGSVGSIAQTRSSDLDLWLCYDARLFPKQALEPLKKKLAAIENWADREAGLEVHFFLMELADIRSNTFGFSDAESAGTTQAKLLKEEFYRTALLMAGREPAWWLTVPGANEQIYTRSLARIGAGRKDQSPMLPSAPPLDMGALETIPREEFFGASLWQIVKALKSPFKSVMKFALLDKYYSRGDVPMLLCDRIKDSLVAGRNGLWDLDPYAVLFREVYEYYKGAKYTDAQTLMRRAFILKTGCTLPESGSARATEERGSSLMEFHYPHSEEPIAREFMPNEMRGGPDTDTVLVRFADLISLGDMVGQFMFRAYENVQANMQRTDMDVMVSAEDLTKVGRKMFSCLKPRKNKVMRISFVDSPKEMFNTLEITCDGLKSGPVTWIVQGESPSSNANKKTELEPVRADPHVQRLAIWLVANGVFSSTTHLTGQNLKPPVSVPDVKEMLQALVEFFPPKKVFDTDIAENLRKEEITKAFILLNFLAPREVKKYEDVAIFYATNWGELFCIPDAKHADLLPKNAREFLRKNTEMALRENTLITSYTPRRALCPRVEVKKEKE